MAPVPPAEDVQAHWSARADDTFDGSWRWPSSSSAPLTSHMFVAVQSSNGLPINSLEVFPASSLSGELLAPTSSVIDATDVDVSPVSPTNVPISRPSSHLHKRPRYSIDSSNEAVSNTSQNPAKIQHPRKSIARATLVSPFKDCLGSFGEVNRRRFDRPFDGKVNGYIKFNWPKDKQPRRASSARAASVSDATSVVEVVGSGADDDSPTTSLTAIGPIPMTASASAMIVAQDFDYHGFDFSSFLHQSPSPIEGFSPTFSHPRTEISTDVTPIGAPRMVPKLFGYEAKMDQTDRKFWTFYIKNWCPGRSVLQETNLWLKDFAQMHKSDGVRAAIQSLAGIYIYDYLPKDDVRKRVNDRFFEAESRLSSLLADPATTNNEGQANELITIAVILSMQDIVLTERRLAWPATPRWLSGFKQGELFLQATDRGARFWKRSNAQLSSLRISQSIIVGRAVILAQPMAALPASETFDPEAEASRFGWLLYGSESDMYEIHGGCGFSKKLLHIMSQITYCAARLQQDPENIVVPMTTQYLLKELLQMRQWSSESKDWETAKAGPSVADWLRCMPDDYQIDTSADMTDVTAEAWRLTAIIYLQCRVLR
ncbi:Protein phosphatase inhibitor [Purpureocillium lavendulum]|uniref:Protein phosphatase inhibitor n=1 Tax=Purpureocillium lavendulum TaxID=1247861 RepID=A0AB34FUK1_9HYPO|nr:Protein phosphatase inhibitor [Purpureocillium lavendulum]